MLLLKKNHLLSYFFARANLNFIRKNDVRINPVVVDILNETNLSESQYLENVAALRKTQQSKNILEFHNNMKLKLEEENLAMVLMDAFSHAGEVIINRQYFELILKHLNKLQTVPQLFAGLKLLIKLRKFSPEERVKLSHEANTATQKMFNRIESKLDQSKQNLEFLCQFASYGAIHGYFPQKVIYCIEENISKQNSKNFICERYFINFLKDYCKYPVYIISRHKEIESLALHPGTTKSIQNFINNVQQKLQLLAAIAKLSFQIRGHFFKTPACFSVLRDITIANLKTTSVCYLLEIVSHIPQSFMKVKDEAIEQFIKITFNQSLRGMLNILQHINVQKIQTSHFQILLPHLLSSMQKHSFTISDLSNLCKYLLNAKGYILPSFCQELYQKTLILCQRQGFDFNKNTLILKFFIKHSYENIFEMIKANIYNSLNRGYEGNNISMDVLIDQVYITQRFYNFNNIQNPNQKFLKEIMKQIQKKISVATVRDLLSVEQDLLFLPYKYIQEIQINLLKRILDVWKQCNKEQKCRLLIHYSPFSFTLRQQLFFLFDGDRQKYPELNNMVFEQLLNLPNYFIPNTKMTFMSVQKILSIMMEDINLTNNKILRFLFRVPSKMMVMKNGNLSKSFISLIDRINLQDFKSINMSWLVESIQKINLIVNMYDTKLMKLYCNCVSHHTKNESPGRYLMLQKYFTIVGQNRDSPYLIHMTENVISKLEEQLAYHLKHNLSRPVLKILTIFQNIGILPDEHILEKCKDVIRSNYNNTMFNDYDKWTLFVLHLNNCLVFDSLFVQQLYFQLQKTIKNKQMNVLALVKFLQIFNIDKISKESDISVLFNKFSKQILQKNQSIRLRSLLKFYKMALHFQITDFKDQLLEIIDRRKLNQHQMLDIVSFLETIDNQNDILLNKIMKTCLQNINNTYPKAKVLACYTLLKMNYTPDQKTMDFLNQMIESLEKQFNQQHQITSHQIYSKLPYQTELLWILIMINKTDSYLFDILKELFLKEMLSDMTLKETKQKWRILQTYFLLDINNHIPNNFKSKFLHNKKNWIIEFKANIPKDIKSLLSREDGWKLYPQVSGYKIMAFNFQNKIALVNMNHRMYRPLTKLQTGYSRCRDMIIKHYFDNPKIVKVDFNNYNKDQVMKQLQGKQ